MKNRKSIVVAFLLIAVMLVGVGYAAVVSDQLTVTGDVHVLKAAAEQDFDDDVYFSAAQVTQDDTGNKAAFQIMEGRDDATITAQHFTVEGQVVKGYFTITNTSTVFDAKVTPSVGTTVTVTPSNPGVEPHAPVVSVVWSWEENSVVGGEATIVGNGGTKTVWVTITLTQPPLMDHEVDFVITFDAEAQPISTGG